MKFLVLGDVVGRPGREAITATLADLKDQHNPDHVIINIENMAHGYGISPETWAEAETWEADVYTTGDHAWDNEGGIPLLENADNRIIRPVNYPAGIPGRGYHVFSSGAFQVAVVNVQGQVMFKNDPLNPFHAMDELLAQPDISSADVVLVDFQAEATSEKRGLGWHLDGHVAAIWGTHTHVPTADAQVLPQGTGYITDIGMTGLHHSIIGADIAPSLKHFQTQLKVKRSFDGEGPREIGGVILEIDPQKGVTESITPLRELVPSS